MIKNPSNTKPKKHLHGSTVIIFKERPGYTFFSIWIPLTEQILIPLVGEALEDFFVYCFNSQNYSMLGASAFNPPKKENSQKKDKRQHPVGLTSFRQQGTKHTTEVLQTTKMSAEVA